MIFLTFGTDKNKCREKHNALIKTLSLKNPSASVFKISDENFSTANFDELISGQTLFAQKYVVGCDHLLKEKEIFEYLKENIKAIADSDNLFLFLETEDVVGWSSDEKAKAIKRQKEIELIKKQANKAQEFNLKKVSAEGEFNIYSIVDAFSARDKNRAWSLYQEALMSGISPEEILWKLIWQVDNMLLVKKTKEQKTMKLKPFVLNKAKASAKNFSDEELANISARFVELYHSTFIGTEEFEFGLEKIILET